MAGDLHTAGPWEAVEHKARAPHAPFADGWWDVYPAERSPYRVPIATLDHSMDHHAPSRAQAESDARLIAAAPELLEALKDFERSAAFIGNAANRTVPEDIAREGIAAWVRCVTNARAAIAKATNSFPEQKEG